MDRDARNLMRPINSDFTSSSLSSNSDLFRSVQATFNRHRPLETSIRPKRMLAPRREVAKCFSSVTHTDSKISRDVATKGKDNTVKDSIVQPPPIAKEAQEDASDSHSSSITHTFDENLDVPIDRTKPDAGAKDVSSCHFESQKKVQFLVGTAASSLGDDDDTRPYHLICVLALAEMEWISTSQVDASSVINHDSKHHNIVNAKLRKLTSLTENAHCSRSVKRWPPAPGTLSERVIGE